MLRYSIGAFQAAHGIAHLVGFEGPWGLGSFAGQPKSPPLLASFAPPVLLALQVLQLPWLVSLVAFVIAALALAARNSCAGIAIAAVISPLAVPRMVAKRGGRRRNQPRDPDRSRHRHLRPRPTLAGPLLTLADGQGR